MQVSKAVIFTAIVCFILPFASAQNISPANPPVWTDILTSPGFNSMASGNYFAFGSNNSFNNPSQLSSISLNDIRPVSHTLALATNLTTLTSSNVGTFPCGTASLPVPAQTFIESFSSVFSPGGIYGIGFEGTFNSPPGGVTNVNSIFEAVFFNENQCYGTNGLGGGDGPNANGREYGVFLDTYNNSIWAYWGTLENVSTAQVQVELTTCWSGPGNCTIGTNQQTPGNGAASPVAGQEYFYEIYPYLTTDPWPANCAFQIRVFSNGNTGTPIYQASIPVNGGPRANTTGIRDIVTAPANSAPITGADWNFCSVIASTSGDQGFASANVNPTGAPTAPGTTLPSPSAMNLYIQRLLVGKH